jgi:hypothetical protein
MKTEFKTDEEKMYLLKIIHHTIKSIESWIFSPAVMHMIAGGDIKGVPEISSYNKSMLELRTKCLEYLEEKDPNELFLKRLYDN